MSNKKLIKIRDLMNNGNTLLGIGPMSINTVDASIEIADEYNIPVMLIASRRQVDCKNIERGYVNNWSTEEFAKYVNEKSRTDNIILARDHGGPWQNTAEVKKRLSLKDAMLSAQDSFAKDIDCGFDIIHIDPSIDIYNQLSFENIFERLTVLYNYCSNYAKIKNRDIEFEIGTEEQMIYINPLSEFTYTINRVNDFCLQNNLKIPLFVVAQIGTKVMEMKNIGILTQNDSNKIFQDIEKLCSFAREKGFYIKVHNTDYLSIDLLNKFPSLKIGAANVAPEFGVCETKSFLKLLEEHYLISLENEFLELAYKSNKWKKWIIVDSNITSREKAIIAGHYVFSSDEFKKIKDNAQKQIKDIKIDKYLKDNIKTSIKKYMYSFGMINKPEQLVL